MSLIKSALREVAPQFVYRLLRQRRGSNAIEASDGAGKSIEEADGERKFGFFGDYKSFEAALGASTGYNTAEIASTVTKRVPTFPQPNREVDGRFQQVHSVLCSVMDRIGKSGLKVLDVGGANGGYYVVCQGLSPNVRFEWTVLETNSMVECGSPLSIRFTAEMPSERFDVVLVSGTLQYLPAPYAFVEEVANKGSWLLLHRVPTTVLAEDRLSVQVAEPAILPGSFPHWSFSEAKLREALCRVGTVELAWGSPQEDAAYVQVGARSRGFLVRFVEA